MTIFEIEAQVVSQAKAKASELGVEFSTLGTDKMASQVWPYFFGLSKANQDAVRAAALKQREQFSQPAEASTGWDIDSLAG